jgi:predicted anti-sigma-YlaC factor YlaD
MDMSCTVVREVLPAYVRDGDGSLSVRRHLSRCPDCRTDLTRYEDLLGSLASLESAVVEPPYALKASLLEIPSHGGRLENVRSHLTANRKVYVPAAAAVLVAGAAAGAALWKARKPATA